MVMLLFLKELTVEGDGSLGSPSLTITQCLTDAGAVKTLQDEVVALDDVVDGQLTVIAFLRHFG